jgi:hypothetical protein
MKVFPLLGKKASTSEDVEPVLIEQKNIIKDE